MSWSLNFVGKPSAVASKLDVYGDALEGQSREEFDEVRAGLKAAVLANSEQAAVSISASGHAYVPGDGTPKQSSCSVEVKKIGYLVL